MEQMIEVFSRINKQRQLDDMPITPLAMFAEAWNYCQNTLNIEVNKLQQEIYQLKTLGNASDTPVNDIGVLLQTIDVEKYHNGWCTINKGESVRILNQDENSFYCELVQKHIDPECPTMFTVLKNYLEVSK